MSGYSIQSIKNLSSLDQLETELLLSHLSSLSREQLLAHPEKELSKKIFKDFKKLEAKRLKNWPIAYLIKHKYFFGLKFKVNKNVLIPRPETELMVEMIIKDLEVVKNKISILDIGCGSGSIIVSLANHFKANKKIDFLASDKSIKALKLAKINAVNNELKGIIKFKRGSLLKPFKKTMESNLKNGKNIIIAANLPYLNKEEMKEVSIKYEPKTALYSAKNGLKHYEELFKQLSKINTNGLVTVFCEINPQQADNLIKILNKKISAKKISLKKDFSNQLRFVIVKL